jgi:hypothetical protein
MNPNQYNEFLKNRRTFKLFKKTEIPVDHKNLLIDAVNYSPAQNCNRNFITILLEDENIKEWFMKNVFYFPPYYDENLKEDLPKEYQMSILTASFVVLYLEVNRNLPLVRHADKRVIIEPNTGDTSIKKINIGLNMAFLANQAYLLGYDVGFVGCSRGLKEVTKDPELLTQLIDIYKKYELDELNLEFELRPTYAVCIGNAYPLGEYKNFDKTIDGERWKDGFYTNRKKHSLNSLENLRTIKNENI